PTRTRFKTRKTTGCGRLLNMQADLVDMQNVKKANDGYAYILTMIDVYTRMIYVEPLKTKRGTEVATAFEKVFKEFTPIQLITDNGVEFYNSHCKALFDSLSIAHGSTSSSQKAAMIERANRTIKTRLSKYMYYKNDDRWIHVIQDVVNGINHSYNRSIKMRPVDVTANIFIEDYSSVAVPKYKLNDTVRINKY
ncbi:unnamed protein product, partial [Auanema sp. JU1783]